MCGRVEDKNSGGIRSSGSWDLSGTNPLAEAVRVLSISGVAEGAMSGTYPISDSRSSARTPLRSRYDGRDFRSATGNPSRRSIVLRILTLTLVLSLFAQAIILTRYWEDHRYLESLAARIIDSSVTPSEQTKQILTFFKGKPRRTNTSFFMFPFLDFLRPTARQVAEQGGDCADRSRLTLILLQLHDVSAEKWTLYSKEGQAKHSVVEVTTEQGKMVADPLFGLFFPRPSGGYYSMAELRADPSLVQERVSEMEAVHQEPLAAPIERYPVSAYPYSYARTMNWDKSLVTRLLYRTLKVFMGNRADDLRRPVWPEEPALVITFGIGLLQILLLSCLLIAWRSAIRQGLALRREARIMNAATSSMPA